MSTIQTNKVKRKYNHAIKPTKTRKKYELYLRKMAFSSSPIREAAVARQKIIKPP